MKVFLVLATCLCVALSVADPITLGSDAADVFDSLDDYSLLDILEVLTLGDLVTVASMSVRSSELIREYKIMPELGLKDATLRLELSGHELLTKVLYLPAGDGSTLPELFVGPRLLLATLKTLCPMFGNVLLIFNYAHPLGHDQMQSIVDHLNRYCAAVPQRAHIINGNGSIGDFKAQNVTSLTIIHPDKFTAFSIHERFPRLTELSVRIDGLFAITERLPHLKHFELLDAACGRFDLPAFAVRNPQIRSVKLDLCAGLGNVELVAEMFPNLQSFHYAPRQISEQSPVPRIMPRRGVNAVRFAKVTSYTVDLLGYSGQVFPANSFVHLQSIRFDALESLTFISSWGINGNDIVDLVGHYKELVRFDCSSSGVTYEEMWRLLGALPRLREITIRQRTEYVYREDFVRLMEETNLDTIRVLMAAQSVDVYRGYMLPGQWHLHTIQHRTRHSRALTYKRE